MEGLKTLIQALCLWGIFVAGFVVASVLIIFWWPFMVLGCIAWGLYQAIKNK